MTFTKEHLKKLAAKGKGGLAAWAQRQLSGAKTKSKSLVFSKRKSTGGFSMAKRRHSRARSSRVGGGMGAAGDVAIGGLAYGAISTNMPALVGMNPLFRLALGYYMMTKATGIAKGAGTAIVATEATRIGSGVSVGGLMGTAGNNTGVYM